jgi:hypothetical protein
VITHEGESVNDVTVTVPFKDEQPQCQVFRVQTQAPLENDTVQYGRTGVYTLQPGSQGLAGKFTRPVGIKVDLPENRSKLEMLTRNGNEITCSFITSTDAGNAGEFKATVRVVENPVTKFFSTFFEQLVTWTSGIF